MKLIIHNTKCNIMNNKLFICIALVGLLVILVITGCAQPKRDIAIIEVNSPADEIDANCRHGDLADEPNAIIGCSLVMGNPELPWTQNVAFIVVPLKDDPNYECIKKHELWHVWYNYEHDPGSAYPC